MVFSPASLMRLAVRSASEPVQLPGEIAGQLSLIDAVPFFTFTVPRPMVTGRVLVSTGGGVTFGVRSTASKPSRMSSWPASATAESLPAPPLATSAVRSRTSTRSSPSSAETTSRPPPGVIVSLPEPPRNVSDEPAPVSVSSPAPPEAVTSKAPTSPTLIASLPPRPLACSVSLDPVSIENTTRLGRSNLMRAPLGSTVKMSPAAAAPLTSTSSRPASPFATSVLSPLFHTSVSSPPPPFIVSLPRSPTMRSSPPPPPRMSLASPPRIRSGPSEPNTVSAPAPPSTDSSVSAPTPSFAVTESLPPRPLTSKRSVAASNVNGPRFVRCNLTRLALASSVSTSPSVGAPLTSEPSLPRSPSATSEPSPWFHTSVSLPPPPSITSSPLPATKRSLPSPPVSVSLLSGPLSTSSPPSPPSPELASSVLLATTVIESLPSPPLTIAVNVPLAGTVWSPAAALFQSEPLLSPPVVWPCTSRPPDTDTVTLSSAPSRLSVAVSSLIDAEPTAAWAGAALAARLAASAAPSAAKILMRFMLGPPDRGCHPIEDPWRPGLLPTEFSRRERVDRRLRLGDDFGLPRHDRPDPHAAHRAHPLTSTPEHRRTGCSAYDRSAHGPVRACPGGRAARPRA